MERPSSVGEVGVKKGYTKYVPRLVVVQNLYSVKEELADDAEGAGATERKTKREGRFD